MTKKQFPYSLLLLCIALTQQIQNRKSCFRLSGTELPQLNKFKYLGVIIPVNGMSYGQHIEDRCTSVLRASLYIKNPAKLLLGTAMNLFELKIFLISTYGIFIWKYLTLSNLEQLEKVETFLKKTLDGHRALRPFSGLPALGGASAH